MTERYTRILSLDTMLYHEQSPIIFSKGALLADNHNKLFILQLQFENIQLKQISALEVEIICKNLDNTELYRCKKTYMDLTAGQNDTFGSKVPIILQNGDVRRFEIVIHQVYFSDESIVELNVSLNQSFPKESIDALDIMKETFIRYISEIKSTSKCIFIPKQHNGSWLCTCGTINAPQTSACRICGIKKDLLFSALDTDLLVQKKLTYDQADRTAQLENESVRDKRIKKIKKILICIAIAVIILGGSGFLIYQKLLFQGSLTMKL